MEIDNWLRSRNSDETARAGSSVFMVLVALGLVILAGWGCKQSSVADHLATGDREMSAGKFADAEHEYQTATQIDPGNPAAHAALAADYAAQSQFPLAEEQYRAALALDSAPAKTHLELGSVLVSENDPAAAEGELRAAIGLDPKSAQAHFRLASLLSTENGRQQEAQAEYQQASALDPSLVMPSASGASGAAVPQPANTASASPALKEVNRKFLLTKNSPVFEQPEETSPVVGKVHRRRFVRVTAIDGDWLRIQMRSGTVGFIPVAAAE